jgi:hypothetical protein
MGVVAAGGGAGIGGEAGAGGGATDGATNAHGAWTFPTAPPKTPSPCNAGLAALKYQLENNGCRYPLA